jgi:uncharacterized protein
MSDVVTNTIVEEYLDFIRDKYFPCVAAKAALAENQVRTMVADHLACPKNDVDILNFLYRFVDEYRVSKKFYHSAVIIFKEPQNSTEENFDQLLWKRLQAISDLDASHYNWDRRVEKDASSPDFSFSIKQEAFYVVALHGNSSRKSRRFKYPALVFNPHEQFEKLRVLNKYIAIREAVRKRDIKFSGSVNPMLADFGESSEVFQYSGVQYDSNWKCPFVSKHEDPEHHSTS